MARAHRRQSAPGGIPPAMEHGTAGPTHPARAHEPGAASPPAGAGACRTPPPPHRSASSKTPLHHSLPHPEGVPPHPAHRRTRAPRSAHRPAAGFRAPQRWISCGANHLRTRAQLDDLHPPVAPPPPLAAQPQPPAQAAQPPTVRHQPAPGETPHRTRPGPAPRCRRHMRPRHRHSRSRAPAACKMETGGWGCPPPTPPQLRRAPWAPYAAEAVLEAPAGSPAAATSLRCRSKIPHRKRKW